MALLDTFAGNKDATRDWAAEPGLRLVLDLDRAALIGVPLGAKYEDLFRLGPAEDSETAKSGELRYLSRGVAANVTKGKITSYFIVFSQGYEGYDAYPGEARLGGNPITLSALTTESALIDRFGQPYWRDEDDDETLLFYERGDVEWQVEIDENAQLRCITLVSPPSLADPTRREMYGVTAPWPPAS
jgi:hypothetical protein